MNNRDKFGSRIGFILVSAGCAIGIGNVWRFPYVAGENGGGIFVLFYLLFLVIMGIPVMTMEFAVGRASGKSAMQAFRQLEKPGSRWHIHGYLCLAGNVVLMMYYTTVSGWMVNYCVKFLSGSFTPGMTPKDVDGVFQALMANPGEMAFWMAVTVIVGFLVCSLGVQNGLERITKVMMSALLILIVVLAVHSFTLEGAGEGISFFLLPSLSKAREQGLGHVIMAAMNQSFFTLSLGIGSMEIFGSYIGKEKTLGGEALQIAGLDTFVALMSGLIIFPACYAYGVKTTQGPPLIFVTLPNVFANMTGGRIWGALFFLFMSFASFSTVIAVFENVIACSMDAFGWKRKKASLIGCVFLLIAGLPCVLGFNVWSGLRFPGIGNVLDFEDFLVSNLLLPVGSLLFLLFCVSRWGWGFDRYLTEANTGEGFRIPAGFKPYFRYVLPVLILIILVQGLLG